MPLLIVLCVGYVPDLPTLDFPITATRTLGMLCLSSVFIFCNKQRNCLMAFIDNGESQVPVVLPDINRYN